jgi:hypothetical protein
MRGYLRAAAAAMLVSMSMFAATPGQSAGAFAVGACAAYGYAFDYVDAGQAETAALAKCAGKQCRVVLSLKRNCAALAIDGRNACGAHGFASAKRLAQAQNVALQHCYKYGGKDCVIRAFACDAKG